MFLDIVFIIVGVAFLGFGGDTLVRGAVDIARRFQITPAVIGLTVVAAGTSMPELVVTLGAHIQGSEDIGVGNVIGSNIFNIGLVLGLSALFVSIPVAQKTLKIEWPFLLATSVLFAIMASRGGVDRLEGLLFFVLLIGFLWSMVRITRRDVVAARNVEEWAETEGLVSARRAWLLALVGLTLLTVGGKIVLLGAESIAEALGIPERIIGITVVAMGTSLPELASSLAAAARGRTDIAVGNVIGSNLFNTLGIVGVTAMARPLPVQPEFRIDIWWMLGFTLLLAPVLFFGRRVTRLDGVVLLVMFSTYMVLLVRG